VQVKTTPEYQDRFRQALDRLGVSDHDRLMLAVSGGPDSLALLMLATAWASDRICVATIDHRLRAESAAEAAHVGNICKELGILQMTLVPAQPIGGNIQSSARIARYSLLEDAAERHDYSLIATAHHADDNVETVLMNLFKGTGISGLKGILPLTGRISRPLLFASRKELEDYASHHGIGHVEDSSNMTDKYSRNFFRLNIIPLIEQIYPGTRENLRNNLPRFREAEMLYRESVDRKLIKLKKPIGDEIHIPVELLRYAVP